MVHSSKNNIMFYGYITRICNSVYTTRTDVINATYTIQISNSPICSSLNNYRCSDNRIMRCYISCFNIEVSITELLRIQHLKRK